MKTYAMMTLGCKVNDYEATYIRQEMNKHFSEVSFKDKADIYLIFTCCVTNTAEAKSRKFIHDARRRNNDSYICTVGCLSQIKHKDNTFDDVDLIIGSDKKEHIVEYILNNIKEDKVDDVIDTKFEKLFIDSYSNKSRSFLKIQDGCNQFCSYCIIPYSRGRERSANHLDVIKQANQLSLTNKEIVLTGIHTGRYNDGEYNLSMLLSELIRIDNLKTIRLSSIEMTEITNEIINLIKESGKIAYHLHIPVQSCSNNVLKRMNRPYTIEEYINRIEYIRSVVPNISISTDLIVGFPGETDDDFLETVNNLKKIKFSFIHMFPYSRKEGTVADSLDNHIDPKVKKERISIINQLQKNITNEYINDFIGKNVDILIERYDDEYSYGYSKQYFYCKIKGKYEIGDIISIGLEKENINEA